MDMLEGRSTVNNFDLDDRTATLLNEMEQEYSHWRQRMEDREKAQAGESGDWEDE